MTRPGPAHPTEDVERALSAATARWLHAGARSAGALGLGCAGLAAVALLVQPLPVPARVAAWVAVALLPAERVLALRLLFDAGLFADLARGSRPLAQALGLLDGALRTLRLRGPSTAPALRPLNDRIRGAQRLLAWHATGVTLQTLAALTLLLTRAPA